DQEVVVGLDRELVANLAVSVAYTWRRGTDFAFEPRTGFTAADYRCSTTSRNGFSSVGCSPNSTLVLAHGNSRTPTNRQHYHRQYNGFEATIMKRLSNKWMARAAFTYNATREYIDGPNSLSNPTRTDASTVLTSGPQLDGGLYAPRSAGSGKGDIVVGAKW